MFDKYTITTHVTETFNKPYVVTMRITKRLVFLGSLNLHDSPTTIVNFDRGDLLVSVQGYPLERDRRNVRLISDTQGLPKRV